MNVLKDRQRRQAAEVMGKIRQLHFIGIGGQV